MAGAFYENAAVIFRYSGLPFPARRLFRGRSGGSRRRVLQLVKGIEHLVPRDRPHQRAVQNQDAARG